MCVVAIVKTAKIMTLNSLGLLYSDNNAHTKAQSAYEEALEIYRTLAKTNPDAYLSEVAMTLNDVRCCYSKDCQDC
jgi:hypothetical protein